MKKELKTAKSKSFAHILIINRVRHGTKFRCPTSQISFLVVNVVNKIVCKHLFWLIMPSLLVILVTDSARARSVSKVVIMSS